MDKTDKVLWHQSGVNRAGEPFVQLMQDDQVIGQFTPQQCRDHARAITEAAEAAEQDAFLLQWTQENIGADRNAAMGMVIEFRKWREARGKKGPPSDPKDFMVTPKHEKPEEHHG